MTRGGRGRTALGLGALVLVGLGVAFGLAEVAVRLVLAPPRFHDAPLEFDPELGFRGVPGYREAGRDDAGPFEFALDAEGWRVPPPAPALPQDAPRLVYFGDSFLVGRGLRAAALLPHVAAQRLAERGTPVEASSYAAIDYGTAQQLLAFRALPETPSAAGVVLVVYVGNDLVNNEPALAGRTDVSAGDYVRPYLSPPDWERAEYLHPWRARLRRVSRLFVTLERGMLSLSRQPRFAWLRPFPPRAAVGPRVQRGAAPRASQEVLRDHDPGSGWSRAWERSFGLIETFRDEVRARGGRFLVVVVPMEEQVVRTARTEALAFSVKHAGGAPLADLLDWELPERRFARFFERAGIDAILAREPLRALAAQGVNPYLRDRHLSAAAHALLADRVVAWWLGEPAPEVEPAKRPVWWVPRAREGLSRLDFRTASHERQLGDGWLEWFDAEAGGGWRIGPRSLALLHDRGGDVVVTGRAGEDAPLPFAVTVEFAGAGTSGLRVDAPGPFTLRFAPPPTGVRARGEYAVVLVGQHAPLDADVRIESLEIEPR